jgi:L-asparaginase
MLAGALATGRSAAASAEIAVLQSPLRSPGDVVREGAGEFEVLVSVARLQQDHRAVGVVGVGNRRGLFPSGGEHALHFFALQGVPIVKLAQGGAPAADPEGLFLAGNNLTESEAAAVLARCLDRFGSPPRAADPDDPTKDELAAIRAYLRPYREAFALASARRLALE